VTALPLTLSIGIAVFPDHGLTSGALLRKADDAMYAAKRAGRDTWRVSTAARAAGSASD
jgi:diguanylate cyclase (GGDEF)-like protein